MRDFWTEQGPTDILLKLKRKEITLFKAAEQLNVTPQTLSNYLISMSVLDNEPSGSFSASTSEYPEVDSDEEGDSILPDVSPTSSLFKNVTSTHASSNSSKSVLPNCPDITIIKKEKLESLMGKMNNNSDHSGNSD